MPMKRLDFSETFRVEVGPERVSFDVHKGIVCERAPFFHIARSPHWIRAGQPVKLHDDQPEVFQAYLTLVYTGKVENNPESAGYPYLGLMKLFILADTLQDLAAANQAMDEILAIPSKMNCYPNKSAIRLAYRETVAGGPIQRVIAHLYVHGPNKLPTSRELMGLPHEFLADVVKEFMSLKNQYPNNTVKQVFSQSISLDDACTYHLHDAEHPKCA